MGSLVLIGSNVLIQVDHRVDSVQKEIRDLGFELHDYINRNKEDLQSISTYFLFLEIIS